MAAKNPKTVTIYGRLSFPNWTAKEAYDLSLKGKYPAKDVASASPSFQLLLDQAQYDKMLTHIKGEFLPYVVDRNKQGETKDELTQDEVDKLLAQIDAGDHGGTYNTPFKLVHEKTAVLAPEAVVTVKVTGNRGVDIERKAIVQNEDELAVPDPDRVQYPAVVPESQSVHSMYPGCYVAATVNLYAYRNGKLPGFSAGASVAVFKADGDRFGGGVTVDEDEIFLD